MVKYLGLVVGVIESANIKDLAQMFCRWLKSHRNLINSTEEYIYVDNVPLLYFKDAFIEDGKLSILLVYANTDEWICATEK